MNQFENDELESDSNFYALLDLLMKCSALFWSPITALNSTYNIRVFR